MNRSLRIFDTSAILNLFNRYYFSQHVCLCAISSFLFSVTFDHSCISSSSHIQRTHIIRKSRSNTLSWLNRFF